MNRLISFLLFLALCLGQQHCFSQQSEIDSLLLTLKDAKEDTNKVNSLNDLAYALRNRTEPDSCIALSMRALSLAEKLKWDIGIAKVYGNLAWFYGLKSDNASSLKYYFKELETWNELGNGAAAEKKIHFELQTARTLAGIGSIYLDQREFQKALDHYSKAVEIEERHHDKNALAVHYGYLGNLYREQKDHPRALIYYNKALKYCVETGRKNVASFWLYNIGSIYREQALEKKYTRSERDSLQRNALTCFFKALAITEELINKRLQTGILGEMGELYSSMGNFSEAEKHFKESLAIAQEIKILDNIQSSEKLLSEFYGTIGKTDLAFEHYKLYVKAKDSLKSEENAKEQVRIETKYEQDKKDKEQELIEKAKEQQHLAEVKQQRTIINSVSGGLLLMFALTFIIFNSYRQKQRANIIITEQKTEVERSKFIIEEKNRDITDSINYAKRIQQAKLPKKEDIFSLLPHSFILFKPKDIVSGDFYYFHQKDDRSGLLAAADCTGHGVPGALMSMIGSEKLDDALTHTADTSQILQHLNRGVKASLHQSDSNESTRDGMDIALCAVDTAARTLRYAGANRPMWIIRNGQASIEEVKATKKAIGGLTGDDQEFESHDIQLGQGDTFYIFTDGYADTFSRQDKKLTTKKFKEILLDIQGKTMEEQGEHLDAFIENWKSGIEQVDDILVIGVRL
jgi:serine phosphatase RsbU (regulator of sigma subunit)